MMTDKLRLTLDAQGVQPDGKGKVTLAQPEPDETTGARCPTCGAEHNWLRREGVLGCPDPFHLAPRCSTCGRPREDRRCTDAFHRQPDPGDVLRDWSEGDPDPGCQPGALTVPEAVRKGCPFCKGQPCRVHEPGGGWHYADCDECIRVTAILSRLVAAKDTAPTQALFNSACDAAANNLARAERAEAALAQAQKELERIVRTADLLNNEATLAVMQCDGCGCITHQTEPFCIACVARRALAGVRDGE